jgi:transposase InsO family protein
MFDTDLAPLHGADLDAAVLSIAARDVAARDASGASDDELLGLAVSLERVRRFLDAASCHVVAELDRRGTTDERAGLRTGTWLAREAGLPHAAATARVRTARTLVDTLPEVDAALTRAEIGMDHANVLAGACNPRIAAEFARCAGLLADGADGALFERWRAEVRGLADQLDADGGHDPAADLARNRLSVGTTIEDTTVLKGQVVGAGGLCVEQTINALADELFHRFQRDRAIDPDLPLPNRATLRALALVEACRRACAVDPASTSAPTADVTLVINAEEPGAVHRPDGVRLQDGTTRALCCDPRLLPVVVDRLGVPLDIGRNSRVPSAAQRRAAALRDGGCTFPGCPSPVSWNDLHHCDDWVLGGRTDTSLLSGLCRHHHVVVHRPGWTVHADPSGWFSFELPSGERIWGQRHGRRRDGPAP